MESNFPAELEPQHPPPRPWSRARPSTHKAIGPPASPPESPTPQPRSAATARPAQSRSREPPPADISQSASSSASSRRPLSVLPRARPRAPPLPIEIQTPPWSRPPGRMLLLKQDILQSSPCIPRLIPASSNRREPARGTRVRVPLARFQRLGFWLCAPVSRQPQEFGIPRLRIKTCGRDNGAQTEPRV